MDFPWGGTLPYNDYSGFSRRRWGGRVQKISVDAGFSCPNRDGRIGTGGCAWCNVAAFVPGYCSPALSIAQQVRAGIEFFAWKYAQQRYLVYFQAFSATYAAAAQLRELYETALSLDGVVGIVVGTRPDTLDDAGIDVLADIAKRTSVCVELGVESTKDATLAAMGRGHDFSSARSAVYRLQAAGIEVGVHLILGLPGESPADFLDHAHRINQLPITTLKIHHLQILEGTRLGREYRDNPELFRLFDVAGYLEVLRVFLTNLRPDIVVERFCNESPDALLLAPRWGGLKNFAFTHLLVAELTKAGQSQGCALSQPAV